MLRGFEQGVARSDPQGSTAPCGERGLEGARAAGQGSRGTQAGRGAGGGEDTGRAPVGDAEAPAARPSGWHRPSAGTSGRGLLELCSFRVCDVGFIPDPDAS